MSHRTKTKGRLVGVKDAAPRKRNRITIQIPDAAEALLERVRVKRGWKAQTPLVLEAIFNHFRGHLGKREATDEVVDKYLARGKEFAL